MIDFSYPTIPFEGSNLSHADCVALNWYSLKPKAMDMALRMLSMHLERYNLERENSDMIQTTRIAWAADCHVALANHLCLLSSMRTPTSD